MLKLSLSAVSRASVRLQGELAPDDLVWNDSGVALVEPLRVELEAQSVGEGVLVRGELRGVLDGACRRCLKPVRVAIEDHVELLFESLTEEEEADLAGEVYPFPARGDELDLTMAIREQVLLRAPDYVVCSEDCQGLCPRCGADRNARECGCVPEEPSSPWDALKNIEFD